MTLRAYPTIREIFGSMVFDRRVMKEKLNQDVYDRLVAAMEGRNYQIGRASCRERV